MTCPQCQGELTKTKLGYMCLICGYSGRLTHGHQLAVEAAERAHPPPSPTVADMAELPTKPLAGALFVPMTKPVPADDSEISAKSESPPAAAGVVHRPADKPATKHAAPTAKITETESVKIAEAKPKLKIGLAAAVLHPDPTVAVTAATPPTVPIEAVPEITAPAIASGVELVNQPVGAIPASGAFNPQAAAALKSEPALDPDQALVSPLALEPAASVEPPTPPPAATKHHRKPMRTVTLVGAIIVILALAVAAYILPAQAATRAFNKKIANAQSFGYTGNLTIKAESFLSVLSSNLDFHGIYATKGPGELDYTGLFASRNYTGTFISNHGQLYTKMAGNDLPFIRYNQGLNTYHLLPATWYQTKLDTGMYKYYCETRPDTKYPSPLVWYQALRQIKLRPSPLVGYAQRVDGHTTTHLQANISGQQLNAAWSNINSSLPDDCQWNTLLEDVSGINVHVDAWTSPSFDKIVLTFKDRDLGVTGTLTMKLSQYNQTATPTVPTTTTDLAGIFSVRAAIQARDYSRRADIDALNAAIKKYYVAKKTLPTALSKLAPADIATIPTDPTSGAQYTYTVTKKTYTLSATLEDSGQLYTVSGP